VLFTGASPRTHLSAIYIVGVDQDTGEVTEPARELALDAPLDVQHAEWVGATDEVVAVVKEGPGRHAVVTVTSAGGTPKVVHRFASEHDNPGMGVSPDGRHVAFIAPAPDGFFQVFRMPIEGGAPTQLTTDPSNKTQPSWSPRGDRVAFTVWEYDARFYLIAGRDSRFGTRDSLRR
jgi:Tol biopolymer transport system component